MRHQQFNWPVISTLVEPPQFMQIQFTQFIKIYFSLTFVIIKDYYKNLQYMTKKMTQSPEQGGESQSQKQDQEGEEQNIVTFEGKESQQEQIAEQQDQLRPEQQDQLRQQVAFHLDVDQFEATQQEKLAFQYIRMVKSQKQLIKRNTNLLQISLHSPQKLQVQRQTSCQTHQDYPRMPDWFQQFQRQVYTNWNCVVQNIKYLISKDSQYEKNDRRKNKKMYEAITMQQTPMIHKLTHLTVGEVEQLMAKFSKQVHQILHQGLKYQEHQSSKYQARQSSKYQVDQTMIKNYNFWIYSLLALHQAWANYKHFQQIGQVNSVIEQLFIRKLFYKNQGAILATLVLLVKQFQQRHMQKLIRAYFQN